MVAKQTNVSDLYHHRLKLRKPIPVSLEPIGGGWLASWPNIEVCADGPSEQDALNRFVQELIHYYYNLRETPLNQLPKLPAIHLNVLRGYIFESR
jgi:hypothetical protein